MVPKKKGLDQNNIFYLRHPHALEALCAHLHAPARAKDVHCQWGRRRCSKRIWDGMGVHGFMLAPVKTFDVNFRHSEMLTGSPILR